MQFASCPCPPAAKVHPRSRTKRALAQLRRLERFVRDNPRDGSARFLLAYHYITLRHSEEAATQLQATLTIYPDDQLSADLLQLLSEEYAREHAYDLPAGRPPTLAELQGEWRAKRADGKIDLEFAGDAFSWDYDLVENDSEFRGRFALNQNVLVLATSTGSQMAGTVTLIDRDHLNFRLLSAQPDDPGVLFARD